MWCLYIDETGKFDSTHEDVAIVGILMKGGAPKRDDALDGIVEDVCRVIDRVFPSLPYPPHATELRCPTAFLAAWILNPQTVPNQTRPGAIETRLERLQLFVEKRAHENEIYWTFVDALKRGNPAKLPNSELLWNVNRELQRNACEDYSVLVRIQEEWDSVFRGYLRWLADVFNGDRSAPCCVVVGAASPPVDDANGRYLALFPAVAGRLGDLLTSADPTPEHVALHVAEAPLALGRDGHYIQLQVSDVRRAIAGELAHGMLPSAPGLNRPDLEVASVTKYRAHTIEPGIVLADFCAHRFNAVPLRVLSRARSWNELCVLYRQVVPFPISRAPLLAALGSKPLPTFAASPVVRKWHRHQADAWSQAVTKARNNGALP